MAAADQLVLDRSEDDLAGVLPLATACPRCGDEVLVVELRGGVTLALEPLEILEGFPCPQCEQVALMGHERGPCARCHNTRIVGDSLPPYGVAVTGEGVARRFTARDGRRDGEAVYHEHRCPLRVV